MPGLSDITFGNRVVKYFVCGMLDYILINLIKTKQRLIVKINLLVGDFNGFGI